MYLSICIYSGAAYFSKASRAPTSSICICDFSKKKREKREKKRYEKGRRINKRRSDFVLSYSFVIAVVIGRFECQVERERENAREKKKKKKSTTSIIGRERAKKGGRKNRSRAAREETSIFTNVPLSHSLSCDVIDARARYTHTETAELREYSV